jgi:uncharacterized protein (TIGR03067 family)
MGARVLMAIAAGLLLAADKPRDDAVQKELKKLEGTWKMAALEIDGKPVPEEQFQDTILVIKGNQYIVKVKKKSYETTFTIEPGKKPKQMDMTFKNGPNKDKVHKGIYSLEGDTFKLCRGQSPDVARPRDFGTWPDTGTFLVVWKRVKK